MIAELKSKLVAGRIAAALTLATLLSACGGGGGASGAAGTPLLGTTPSGTSSAVASLSVAPAPVTLPNDGSATATITVTALDASNVTLKGVPISFSADSGTISPVGTVTDDKGELKATLGIGDNKTKRTITITAAAGGVSKTAAVSVVESTTAQPVVADASLGLSKSSIQNAGTESVEATVTALDDARNTLPNIPVKFRIEDSANSAYLESAATATDAKGQAKVTAKIGTDRNNRTISVIAEVGTLTRKASFRVTGAKLNAALAQTSLTAGQPGKVEYTLLDAAGVPISKAAITVSGPAGASGSGTTDDLGKYVYTYTAAGSGPTVIAAVAPGDVRVESVIQVGAAVSDVPAATVIQSATFTAAPLVVAVNQPGSTTNRGELRLLFRTNNNQPVPNVRVRLGLGGNASGTDGQISTGNDQVIVADASGVATSSFIPGRLSSPTGGVKVYACFGKTDAVEQVSACPVDRLRDVTLTVVEEPVSVSIGTNGLLIINTNTYAQDFVVLVTDSAGNPKADVQLAAVLDLPSYWKGTWVRVGSKWEQRSTAQCWNEDNSPTGYRNNTIESGEDKNGNGQLDPRKSDATVTFVGASKTDANGQAVVRMEYAQSTGGWAEYSLRVSATTVVSPPAWWGRQGSFESWTGTIQALGVPVTVTSAEAKPPFQLSPYGVASTALPTDPTNDICKNPN